MTKILRSILFLELIICAKIPGIAFIEKAKMSTPSKSSFSAIEPKLMARTKKSNDSVGGTSLERVVETVGST